MIGDSNDNAYFLHKLLTNTQVSRLCKVFPKNSSANIKLLKTQLPKMVQLGQFWGRLLGPLLKTDFSLMTNALAKSFLILLVLTAVASAADKAIHKKN